MHRPHRFIYVPPSDFRECARGLLFPKTERHDRWRLRTTPRGDLVFVALQRQCQVFDCLPDGTLSRRDVYVSDDASDAFEQALDVAWAFVDGSWCMLMTLQHGVTQWTLLDSRPSVRRFCSVTSPTCVSAAGGRLAVMCDLEPWVRGVQVFDVKDPAHILTSVSTGHFLKQPYEGVALSGDGSTFAAVVTRNLDVVVEVHSARTGAVVHQVSATYEEFWIYGRHLRVCATPCGNWLLSIDRHVCISVGRDVSEDLKHAFGSAGGVAPGANGSVFAVYEDDLVVYCPSPARRMYKMSPVRVVWLACVVRVPQQPAHAVAKRLKM